VADREREGRGEDESVDVDVDVNRKVGRWVEGCGGEGTRG
jgi:hypothetical protein